MFADGLIDRNTPCKPADRGDWKTVDDYLPILKYGTQLPPPTQVVTSPPATPPPVLFSQRVFSRGFRHSVLVGSKNNVQMDGCGFPCLLLLFAGDHRRLADYHGSICRAN
jgi:hypothetical protein